MKILILSNVYPPYFIGGYELACHEIAERLQAAGHRVAVLTSSYGVPALGKSEGARERGSEGGKGRAFGVPPVGTSSPPSLPRSLAPSLSRPENGVYRTLYYHTVPRFRLRSMRQRGVVEYRDLQALRRVLAAERPELIYVWNMGGLTRSLLEVAHDYPAPVVYEIFDGWLAQPPDVCEWAAFWQRPSLHPIKRYLKAPARLLAGRLLPIDLPVLDLGHVVFKSQMLKRAALAFGLPVAEAPVIYHGVNRGVFRPLGAEGALGVEGERERGSEGVTEGEPTVATPFSPSLPRSLAPSPPRSPRGCRILYVGQLALHKGVHTLVDAFARVARDPGCAGASLTIAGGSIHPEYVAELRAAVTFHELGERVRFLDMVPRYELPGVYREHDVLVFPSTWEEPFGLTQVEAMACGRPVIGTGTGGSAEILTEETALRFPPGDVAALAERLTLLAADPDRRRRMGAAALERVARHFDLDQTARQTEEYLRDVAATWTPASPAQWKIPFAADNPSGTE